MVKAGRSRFTLSSLPASEFPVIEEINAKQVIRVGREHFRRLIEKTHFAMAQQDVRYYLNGTMLETSGKTLRAVATDGHRLSLAETSRRVSALPMCCCALWRRLRRSGFPRQATAR